MTSSETRRARSPDDSIIAGAATITGSGGLPGCLPASLGRVGASPFGADRIDLVPNLTAAFAATAATFAVFSRLLVPPPFPPPLPLLMSAADARAESASSAGLSFKVDVTLQRDVLDRCGCN